MFELPDRARWAGLPSKSARDGNLWSWQTTFAGYVQDEDDDLDAWLTLARLYHADGFYANAHWICSRKLQSLSPQPRIGPPTWDRSSFVLHGLAGPPAREEAHVDKQVREIEEGRARLLRNPNEDVVWEDLAVEFASGREELLMALWALAVVVVALGDRLDEDRLQGLECTARLWALTAEGQTLWCEVCQRREISDIVHICRRDRSDRIRGMNALFAECFGIELSNRPQSVQAALSRPGDLAQ